MPDDSEVLLRLAQAVSDGTELEIALPSDSALDRTMLSDLEALAKLGAFHRETHEEEPPADPENWGPLRILERIGRGGFGEVYRALDPRLEREVALKLLRIDRGDLKRRKQAILKEARLLAKIHHPNVAAVYGADEFEGRVGLWMELIQGTTLEQWIERHGTLSAAEATVVALDLCRALAAVHGKGLVHRDVTARNVMRRSGGRILLTDFGLGESAEEPGTEKGLTGTPLYLPPEAFEGRPVDARGDIYSMGVLLYFLVTGGFPLPARDLDELRRMHLGKRMRHLRDARPGLPAWFVQAVEAALAPDPDDRYASVAELERALLAGSSPIALPGAASARRSRAPYWVLAALLAALGAVSAFNFLDTDRAPALTTDSAPALPFTGFVVSDVDNQTGDPELEVVGKLLRDRLDDFGFFNVADSVTLAEQGMDFGERFEGKEALALADGLFQFPIVVTAEVRRIGTAYLLTVRVLHVGAADAGLRGSWAQGSDFSGKEAMPEAVARAAAWLQGLVPELKAQVLFREADGLFKQQRKDEAIPKLQLAIKTHPDFPLALARLGNWLIDGGRFREGYRLELRARDLLSEIETPLWAESRALVVVWQDIEDYRQLELASRQHLERFADYNDDDKRFGYFYLAFAQGALGKWEEAISSYRDAGGFHASIQTAHLRFAQGELEEADEAIGQAQKLAEKLNAPMAWIWRLQGALSYLRGEPDLALEALGKLRNSPDSSDQSDSMAASGYIAGERGQWRRALEALDEGIEHDGLYPHLAGARNDKRLAKGYLLLRLGQIAELHDLCLGEDFRGETPYRQSKAGILLARAGLLDEAETVLSWIEGQFVEDVPISRRSRDMLRGEILMRSDQPDEGLKLLRQVADEQPAFYHREYLARALRDARRFDEALDEYEKFAAQPGIFWFLSVNEQYPGLYADTLLDYARLAVEMGRNREAESALKRYLELRKGVDDALKEEDSEARRMLAMVSSGR